MVRFCAVSALLAVASSTAFGSFTITNGNATFSSTSTPFLQDSTLSTADFRPDGGSTTDHLFYYNWSYRVGTSGNRGFSWLDTPVQSVNGDTVTFTYSNAGPNASGQNRFNAVLSIQIIDGANPGEASLVSTMVFTAAANNAGNTTWELLHGVDLDLGGTATGDTYAVGNNTAVSGTVTDPASTVSATWLGAGASRYEYGTGSTLRGKLTGGTSTNLSTLAGSTLASFTGDGAVALQWSAITLAPGESRTFSSTIAIVPAPGAVALLGLGGLVAGRRRR